MKKKSKKKLPKISLYPDGGNVLKDKTIGIPGTTGIINTPVAATSTESLTIPYVRTYTAPSGQRVNLQYNLPNDPNKPHTAQDLANPNYYRNVPVQTLSDTEFNSFIEKYPKQVVPTFPDGGNFLQKTGELLGNYGKAVADTALGTFGATNVIQDSAYKGTGAEAMKKTANIGSTIGRTVLPMIPGVGQIAMAAQTVGTAFNPQAEQQLDEYGNPVQQFAKGGIYNGQPNAELEKKEVMQMPDGTTEQVNAPSHEQGGVEVALPNKTSIFSDRLKHPILKKTFAKLAAKFKTNKEEKVITDIDASSTSKRSAQLMFDSKNKALDTLFNEQESLKQEKFQKGVQRLQKKWGGKMPSVYCLGGKMGMHKYPNGGYSTKEGTFDQFGNQIADPYGQSMVRAIPTQNLMDRDKVFNEQDVFDRIAENQSLQQQPLRQTTPATQSSDNKFSLSNQQKDALGYSIGAVAQNLGTLAYLKQQGRRYDTQPFHEFTPQMLSAKEPLRQADIEGRVAAQNIASASGGNSGAYLANRVGLGSNIARTKAGIVEDIANRNAAITNQGKQFNIANQYMTDDVTARNKGQAQTNYYNSLNQLGQSASGAYKDYRTTQMERGQVGMLPELYNIYKTNPELQKILMKYK